MIQDDLHIILHKGERYTNQQIRRLLQSLYDLYQIKKKAKSTDLAYFGFKTKRATKRIGDKRFEGIKIL